MISAVTPSVKFEDRIYAITLDFGVLDANTIIPLTPCLFSIVFQGMLFRVLLQNKVVVSITYQKTKNTKKNQLVLFIPNMDPVRYLLRVFD